MYTITISHFSSQPKLWFDYEKKKIKPQSILLQDIRNENEHKCSIIYNTQFIYDTQSLIFKQIHV